LARALALHPDSEQALVGMGELAYAQKQWSDAILHFERSKTAQVPVLLKLCRANLMAHRREKALETAAVVRAFAKQDAAALGELSSMLAEPMPSEEGYPPAEQRPPAEVRPSP
jgi:uncharacterized protein HemY